MSQIEIREKRIEINPVRDKLTSFSTLEVRSISFQIFDRVYQTEEEKEQIGQIIVLSEDPTWIN